MIEMAETAQRLLAGRSREDLDTDVALSLAVARALEIFGEAAARIGPELKSASPDIP